jgi:hypothetical protein
LTFFMSKKEISVFFRNVCERILTHRRNYLQFVIFLLCVFATAGHVFFKLEKSLITLNKKTGRAVAKNHKNSTPLRFFCELKTRRDNLSSEEKKEKKSLFAFFIITYYRFDSDSNVKKSFWCYHTLVGEYKK